MDYQLFFDIFKWAAGGLFLVGTWLYRNHSVQIKAMWNKIDQLQAVEMKRHKEFNDFNLQIIRLNQHTKHIENLLEAQGKVLADILEEEKHHHHDDEASEGSPV